MANNDRKSIPKKTYDVAITIKGNDYTPDLIGVQLLTSLLSPYPIVELDLLLDSNDIILEELYGEDPIKVNLRTHGAGDELLEQIDLDLMMLDTSYELTNKDQISDNKEKDKRPFNIKSICRKPFETMTSLVNSVYIGTTLRDILNDLVKNQAGARALHYDTDGENTEEVGQVVIPPTTLYKIIKENEPGGDSEGFLDSHFGLFSGIPAVYCDYQNEVHIKNLSTRINKAQTLTVYHLSDGKESEDVIKDSPDGKTFYTYRSVSTSYGANKRLAMISNNINYVRKPTDALYEITPYKLTDIASQFGLVTGGKEVHLSQSVGKRNKYEISGNYNNYSDILVHSRLSRLISNLSNIEITINGRFQMENLMKVGDAVKFKPQTAEYSDLGGKYILFASTIDLTRGFSQGTQWASECRMRLMRTVV